MEPSSEAAQIPAALHAVHGSCILSVTLKMTSCCKLMAAVTLSAIDWTELASESPAAATKCGAMNFPAYAYIYWWLPSRDIISANQDVIMSNDH
jgi:hypothetical protein